MSLSMCCLCIVESGHVRRKGVHRKYKTLSVVSGQDCRVLSITSVVFYRHELALARLDKGGKSATAPLFAARLHLRALGDRVGARRARAILARCSRRWQVRGARAITCSAPRAFMLAVQVGSQTCVRYCQVFIRLVIGRVWVHFLLMRFGLRSTIEIGAFMMMNMMSARMLIRSMALR